MRVRHVLVLLLAAALNLAVSLGALGIAGLDPPRALAAGQSQLKVAIIVGPVGSMTSYYRRLADQGAAVARRHAEQVVTVYSPNATWPAVRRALDGASIVVYLGHGNGWPSRYSSVLRPATQDGLGLNPVAGVDDEAHQYFGEQYLRKYVKLAPGAVVLLNHLCYASGAAEPGMANPSLAVAVQRVDNFGAGFLAAGASAVVAEAHGGPAWYLNAIFAGRGTIEGIWRAHPSFHGHLQAFDGVRSEGARLYLDPDRQASGYYRSLVVRPGLRTADVLAGTPRVSSIRDRSTLEPGPSLSLAALGASPARVRLAGPLVAGADASLGLVFDAKTAALLPDAFTIGTRWNLLAPDGDPGATGPAASTTPSPAPSPVASTPSPDPAAWTSPAIALPLAPLPLARLPLAPLPAVPTPGIGAGPPAGAAALPAPTATPPVEDGVPAPTPAVPGAPVADPAPLPSVAPSPSGLDAPVAAPDPPAVDLVSQEVPGSLVTLSPTSAGKRKPAVAVAVPSAPGLYRLVTTLHDASGVAFDAATQELIPALIVRVTGPLWASYGTPGQVSVGPGRRLEVRVAVANSGSASWGTRPVEDLVDPGPILEADPPLLVARWVALDGVTDAAELPAPGGSVPAYVDPGTSTTLGMVLVAPEAEGQYLLLLDIRLADGRSLAAAGVPPGLVRVTVGGAQPAVGPVVPSQSPSASTAPSPMP